ncbi:MAG: FAD-linked oxidase C-terminal domain-containing protein [Sandaracinaceae bacterium]
MLPSGLADALRAALGRDGVVEAEAQRRTYEMDGLTGYRETPGLVVLPRSTAEVAEAVRICARLGVPIVPRGSGTGLSGGALPRRDGVLFALSRMRRILSIDPVNQRAVVEPGVTNLAVSQAAAPHGLYYAPDPSSQQICSIGGNVAENSGGAHCLKYGFTTHHVLAVEVVLGDGSVVDLGDAVLDPPGYDLRGVFVGSEGTLGICTKAVLRLLRVPEGTRTLVADFPSPTAAGDAVTAVIGAGIVPAAVEMLDTLAIEACEAATGAGYTRGCGAALVVEVDGPEDGLDAELEAILAICRDRGCEKIRVAQDGAERAAIWRGRTAAFAAVGRLSPDYYVQDGVIPRTELGAVLARIAELAAEAGLRVANVFHAGDGNLHPLVLYDAGVEGEAERGETLATRIAELCVEHGGSITGEHGVGVDKACSMPKMFSEEDLAVMERVRRAFDPDGRCNPDKLLPTPRLCGERPGPYRPHPLEAAGLIERL